MSKKLKYIHVVQKITESMRNGLMEMPKRSGMYNWMFIFQGSIVQYNDLLPGELEKYDVVQTNLAPADQLLVPEIQKQLKNSSTLLIGNNDYVPDYWDHWGQHPSQYMHYQEMCDGVFGTEPHQTGQMIDGAFCIPHPTDIKTLKKIKTDDLDMTRQKVGIYYHWWEGRTYTQSLNMLKLRQNFPKIITRLYGYTGQRDRSKQWVKSMYDKIMNLYNYPDFINSLLTNRMFYDNCNYHTYGRTTVDTAALRIPSVGSERIFSMKHCHPETSFDPYDSKNQIRVMSEILRDTEWSQKQVDYAYDACEYFNYENSKERYLAMIDEVKKRCKR